MHFCGDLRNLREQKLRGLKPDGSKRYRKYLSKKSRHQTGLSFISNPSPGSGFGDLASYYIQCATCLEPFNLRFIVGMVNRYVFNGAVFMVKHYR